jgi:hypothetical protein
MIPITHFALGMAVALVTLASRVDNSTVPAVMVGGGIFAMIPDLAHFLDPLQSLHEGFWTNIFVVHGLLDAIETSYPNIEASIALAMLCTAAILYRKT